MKKILVILLTSTLVIFGVNLGNFELLKFDFAETQSNIIFENFDKKLTIETSADQIVNTINATDGIYVVLKLSIDGYEAQRPTSDDLSMEEVKTFLRDHRKKVREYHSQINQEVMKELGLLSIDADAYYSSYAPYLFLTFEEDLTVENYDYIINTLETPYVETIYFKKAKVESALFEFESAIAGVNGTEIIGSPLYTGLDVVIGILDEGIVDSSHDNFEGINLSVRNEWWYSETVSEHATQVASIAGGINGIARESSILSVEVSGEPSGEIEWMLNRHVNVINMSFGYLSSSSLGDYTSEAAYIDYIVRNSFVTFVGSAGNRGDSDKYVTSPKTGYNVITVGATNDSGNLAYFSSYEEKFAISKPTLVAPGSYISIPGFSGIHSGTSFSAPIVTGTVALIMQHRSLLLLYPEAIKALLTANIQPLDGYTAFDSSGLEDKVGSGMLDISSTLEASSIIGNFYNDENVPGQDVYTKLVYLNAGQRIRIAAIWLVNSDKSASTNKVTDYDLFLYDGAVMKKSARSGYNNVEFVDYTANSSGQYTIKVTLAASRKTSTADVGGVSYRIIG